MVVVVVVVVEVGASLTSSSKKKSFMHLIYSIQQVFHTLRTGNWVPVDDDEKGKEKNAVQTKTHLFELLSQVVI